MDFVRVATTRTSATLLVELLTEELPPKALKTLGQAFAERIVESLAEAGLTSGNASAVTTFATPRRLGVAISDVLDRAADRIETKRLMPAKVAYDASGAPSPALMKRLEKEGADASLLSRREEAGVDSVWLEQTREGVTLAAGLQQALDDAIAKLPIPKRMGYQLYDEQGRETTVQFVRPAHGLVAMHHGAIVPVHALGIQAGNQTAGHRFIGKRFVALRSADDYADVLRDDGKVIASFTDRRESIRRQLIEAAGDDRVVMPDALLDEVTALVEWPVVYRGTFDQRFLDVPQECLILTMQQNQKYFALTEASDAAVDRLVNRFLVVSNIETGDPTAIVGGNERVLRARLADAKFFFDQDRKKTLEDRVEGLKTVVHHNQLGTQYERMLRVEALAGQIAGMLGVNADDARRAAHIAKADLLTDMVGEFPELQGLMGRYYATHDGEKPDVAAAIEEQYRPRFAGDTLPATTIGTCLALADKLEAIAGMFGIGALPTGDKDPFALRRHALGVVRMLIEKRLRLSLKQVVQAAIDVMPPAARAANAQIVDFILDRAMSYFIDRGFAVKAIQSVLVPLGHETELYVIDTIVPEASSFMGTDEGRKLAEANKRIKNILEKSGGSRAISLGMSFVNMPKPDAALFTEDAERNFWAALTDIGEASLALSRNQHFAESLHALSGLAAPTAAFFDQVMVNVDDPAIRDNRLTLLQHARAYMNQVAELSTMAG